MGQTCLSYSYEIKQCSRVNISALVFLSIIACVRDAFFSNRLLNTDTQIIWTL